MSSAEGSLQAPLTQPGLFIVARSASRAQKSIVILRRRVRARFSSWRMRLSTLSPDTAEGSAR